ncbi:hypothetical protein [Vibrio sp. D431a]|uniref:hypothetical protein n=1 Tax=Vibrio sp. D431a TaxID=2837388 RepID=UPI00255623DE|nr:hypothetical protein [Vibrio sp. D431a]MDK9789967.1 hypothetical protein [Vibrio sp. D431a]
MHNIKFNPDTVDAILDRFEFNLVRSEHGILHWCRVMSNGLHLASLDDRVNRQVVFWFALFHDCCRENEYEDPLHGSRAAAFIEEFKDELFLNRDDIEILKEACATHSDGTHSDNPTIAACHDADRLDLARVGIVPDAKYLTSENAKDEKLMETCTVRGFSWAVPYEIIEDLGLNHIFEEHQFG